MCCKAGELSLAKSTYLLKEPEHPGLSIELWFDNPDYGKENEYTKVGDFYIKPENPHWRKHKSCFTNPTYCIVVASFQYNEDKYTLEFIEDRIKYLDKKQKKIFLALVARGYKILNGTNISKELLYGIKRQLHEIKG